MLTNITEEELEFIELLHYPIALIECLFSNLDNLSLFNDNFSHVRLYQYSLLSYEYLIDKDNNKTEKENFKLREGAGNTWCFGGRLFGKSLFVEKLDILLSFLLLNNDRAGFTSYDAIHIRGILEDIIRAIEQHPILSEYKERINRSPNYFISSKNGFTLESVNMNIQSKNPGSGFFQKHFTKLFVEEASFETDEVNKKRAESISELGCVIRSSGMTNFTKYSPAGRIWNDLTKRPWLINYPQYVNPTFDEKARMNAIKKHHGENTVSYRVFVEGEVVEEGISVFDMERIRSNNYLENKKIKHFEINKNNLANHKDILILERPNNAEVVFICADIGETAPTKIIIIFKINNKYRYDYKITLYNLTDKEQEIIFDYLIQTLKANIISLDCGEGLGRVIYRYLEEKYGKEHLVYYDGSKKIKVDFERDENNNVIFKNGEPVYKEEFMSEWSIQRLKHLLYEGLLLIPENDYEFDEQFNSVISMSSGNRVIYECLTEEDHLFDAFKVFAIAQWDKEFSIIKPVKVKKFFKSGV